MLKIYKYIKSARSFPLAGKLRYFGNEDCVKYDCKRPPPVDEEDPDDKKLHEMDKPSVFKCKCHKDPKIYKYIFIFVCVPSIICIYTMFLFHEEHPKRMKFVEFPHLRIRTSEFPWDPVRTLFHNPKYNALPTGYEVEFPEEDECDPFYNSKDY